MKTLTAIALASFAGSAAAQTASFTLDLGSFVAPIDDLSITQIDTSALTDDFVAFRVTTDWSVNAPGPTFDPFSSEANVFFGDPSTFTIISDNPFAFNGQADALPVAGLGFVGAFDTSPSSFPVVDFVVDSGGFGAVNFDNTVIEWFTADDLPSISTTIGGGPVSANAPTDFIDLGVLGAVGDTFNFDTFGSDGDTELGIYAADGTLLGSNDDAGGTLQSAVTIGNTSGIEVDAEGNISLVTSTLAAGDYFLAISEFNSFFDPDFAVTGGIEDGDLIDVFVNLNGSEVANFDLTIANDPQFLRFTIVPAPATAGLLGLGGLLAARRRR